MRLNIANRTTPMPLLPKFFSFTEFQFLSDKQLAHYLWSSIYQVSDTNNVAFRGGVFFYNGKSTLITADFSGISFFAVVYTHTHNEKDKKPKKEILKIVQLNHQKKKSSLSSSAVLNIINTNGADSISKGIGCKFSIKIFGIYNSTAEAEKVYQAENILEQCLKEKFEDLDEEGAFNHEDLEGTLVFFKELKKNESIMTGILERNRNDRLSPIFFQKVSLIFNRLLRWLPYDDYRQKSRWNTFDNQAYDNDNSHIKSSPENQFFKVIEEKDIAYERNEEEEQQGFSQDILFATYQGKKVNVMKISSLSFTATYLKKFSLYDKMKGLHKKDCFVSTRHYMHMEDNNDQLFPRLTGPNIVGIEGIIKNGKNQPKAIVLDRYSSTLSHMLKQEKDLSMIERLEMALQIITAVIQCHNYNLTLLESLAPQKIWVKTVGKGGEQRHAAALRLKLFFQKKEGGTIQASTTNDRCLRYYPPEFLLDTRDTFPRAVDFYIFSMVLYELLTGKQPHEDLDVSGFQFMDAVVYKNLRPKIPDNILDKLKKLEIKDLIVEDLLKKCWLKDAQQRPTGGQIKNILEKCLNILKNDNTSSSKKDKDDDISEKTISREGSKEKELSHSALFSNNSTRQTNSSSEIGNVKKTL